MFSEKTNSSCHFLIYTKSDTIKIDIDFRYYRSCRHFKNILEHLQKPRNKNGFLAKTIKRFSVYKP